VCKGNDWRAHLGILHLKCVIQESIPTHSIRRVIGNCKGEVWCQKPSILGGNESNQNSPLWEGFGYVLEQQNGYANEQMKDKRQRLRYNLI